MQLKEIVIQVPGSAPETKLTIYLLDTPKEHIGITKRPVVIFCPGGGYDFTSFREGEPLAMEFLSRGYHACIMEYSTSPVRFPVALMELGTAVKIVREHAKQWHIDENAVVIQGSSAGGHLAGCLGVFWNQGLLAKKLNTTKEMLKPNGLILSYPVISAKEGVIHDGSFQSLLGEKVEGKKESLSLEKLITEDMPPCFLWHTNEDTTVPAENSLLFAMALRENRIPLELHLFEKGIHGLGTATQLSQRPDGTAVQKECECWVGLADVWLKNLCQQK